LAVGKSRATLVFHEKLLVMLCRDESIFAA
jgi:hypothetical protein